MTNVSNFQITKNKEKKLKLRNISGIFRNFDFDLEAPPPLDIFFRFDFRNQRIKILRNTLRSLISKTKSQKRPALILSSVLQNIC